MNAIDYADFRQMKSFRLRFPLSRSRIRRKMENTARCTSNGRSTTPFWIGRTTPDTSRYCSAGPARRARPRPSVIWPSPSTTMSKSISRRTSESAMRSPAIWTSGKSSPRSNTSPAFRSFPERPSFSSTRSKNVPGRFPRSASSARRCGRCTLQPQGLFSSSCSTT